MDDVPLAPGLIEGAGFQFEEAGGRIIGAMALISLNWRRAELDLPRRKTETQPGAQSLPENST